MTLDALSVARADVEDAVRRLHRARLLDPARKIRPGREGRVVVPVRDGAAARACVEGLQVEVAVDDAPLPREGRVTPHEAVIAALAREIDPALAAEAPDKWELHGDVLVLKLPPALGPHGEPVGRAFAEVFGLRSVLLDEGGVAGELREMTARALFGSDPVATHIENGVRYRFDASRIMFSSGNLPERMRAATFPARGETIVDMFAGIGYFTLPLAVHARPAVIHALEKNPVSHRYLCENVTLNDVGDIVRPWLGDNRTFPERGIADRVMMGYVRGTRDFLPTGFDLLKPEGGMIHLHDTAPEPTWERELSDAIHAAAATRGVRASIDRARIVKSYSPGVVHAVMDVRIVGSSTT